MNILRGLELNSSAMMLRAHHVRQTCYLNVFLLKVVIQAVESWGILTFPNIASAFWAYFLLNMQDILNRISLCSLDKEMVALAV